jgi:TRAP-type uncharacterized transport system substrate-binding protein
VSPIALAPIRHALICFALSSATLLLGAAAPAPATAQVLEGNDLAKLTPELREKVSENAGTVSVLVSGSTCTCARFAEDIRNVVNDAGAERPGGVRLIPVLGEGGLQNLKDTLFLRDVNMAMVDENTLKVLKASNPKAYKDIDKKLRYITKLYNAELHILTKQSIKSVADLEGKAINLDYKDSETDLIASRLFGTLGINIKPVHDDQRLALKRLLSDEIAAVAVSTGAPQEILARLGAESGLHFMPIDVASVGSRDLGPILDDYLPAELTHEMYPNLIAEGEAVPTLASRVLLVIYNWDEDHTRSKRNGQFVREFFSRIDEFRNSARHPKWKDVNLAAEVPGWTRFKPAQDWLDENQAAASKAAAAGAGAGQTSQTVSGAEAQKTMADRFITQRPADADPAAGDKDKLFSEFEKFWNSPAARGDQR